MRRPLTWDERLDELDQLLVGRVCMYQSQRGYLTTEQSLKLAVCHLARQRDLIRADLSKCLALGYRPMIVIKGS